MTHWKKIDRENLPVPHGLVFLNYQTGQTGFADEYDINGEAISIYYDGLKHLANATHYLDPSEIPMPAEVKLDWWRPGYDQYIAIHNGMMYKAYGIGDFGNYRATAQEKGKTPIYIDGPGLRSLDAAKAACERYAANLLN